MVMMLEWISRRGSISVLNSFERYGLAAFCSFSTWVEGMAFVLSLQVGGFWGDGLRCCLPAVTVVVLFMGIEVSRLIGCCSKSFRLHGPLCPAEEHTERVFRMIVSLSCLLIDISCSVCYVLR